MKLWSTLTSCARRLEKQNKKAPVRPPRHITGAARKASRREARTLCHSYTNGIALFVSRRNSNALRIMEFSIRNSTPSMVMRGFLAVT